MTNTEGYLDFMKKHGYKYNSTTQTFDESNWKKVKGFFREVLDETNRKAIEEGTFNQKILQASEVRAIYASNITNFLIARFIAKRTNANFNDVMLFFIFCEAVRLNVLIRKLYLKK